MFDAQDNPRTESTYECLQCGEITQAMSHPGSCSECGGDIQNRANSLE
ncbi:rubrerythrin-like domain-containing protein [Natrinema halophilum]|nr:rubrerythrin-like domain-containing protein [Natrinema halophilum]UHQ96151.1 rubrerythrin-like domain-containing protein [Natrinema halophilum]